MSQESWLFVFAAVSALGGAATIVDLWLRVRAMMPQENVIKVSRRRAALVGLLLLASFGLSSWGFIGSIRNPAQVTTDWNNFKYTTVYGRTFEAQTVPLDGMSFVNCTFHSVTFEYEGKAPFQITGSTAMGGKLRVLAKDPRTEAGLQILGVIVKITGAVPEWNWEHGVPPLPN